MSLILAAVLVVVLLLVVLTLLLVRALIALALAVILVLVAGLIAQTVTGNSGARGLIAAPAVGLAGAVAGSVVAWVANFPTLVTVGGLPIVWTVLGAIVVGFVWKLFQPSAERAEA